MGVNNKIRISTHIEVEWLETARAVALCPNCGTQAPMRQILEIDYRPPDAHHRYILHVCPNCTARFVDNTQIMDYSTDELIEIGWNNYQVQLGAGVWPISAPLTRIDKPRGARVLEIGGAYGFGLDFCIRARGWQGEGFDPSPLAAFGARELELNIAQEYFEEKNLVDGPWDVAISTEVIEHLEHPPAYFALMRKALAEDGILVVTTPDAEWVTPELSALALMPLLSPGAHLVLQTTDSLRGALQAAGFAHVVVVRESMSLVAYASPLPFTLNDDAAAARAMYRRYLVERGKLTDAMSDLRLGFAGRGLFEAANDDDVDAVEAAWAALLPAVRQRFGIDLEAPVMPEGAQDASLAELARMMPLGLGMILFGRAMQLLNAGAGRATVLPVFQTALAGVTALQNALGKRSLTDGLSASIGKILRVEILLSQAETANASCLSGLIEIGDETVGWRGFVAFVNANERGLARQLKAAILPDLPSEAVPAGVRRDALLSLANFDLVAGGDTMRALNVVPSLYALGAEADAERILLEAFVNLVNAAEFGAARGVLPQVDPLLIKLAPPYGQAGHNGLFAAGVLLLQERDDARRSAAVFARLRDALIKLTPPPASPDDLFWPALRGEVMALHRLKRGAEATALLEEFTASYPGAPDDLLEQIGMSAR
jgi:SAM-dependent methyltransferase